MANALRQCVFALVWLAYVLYYATVLQMLNLGRVFDVQDKILQSMSRGNDVTVTNDGATILKSIYIDNPAAKVLVGECACS